MLESIPVAIGIGSLLGFLSGLGIGGGSLLMLWLTLVLHMPQDIAATINLLFFIPSALIATAFHCKKGTVDFKHTLPALIAGCVGALLLSQISTEIDIAFLRKAFGILLLVTGIREIFYRPRNAR